MTHSFHFGKMNIMKPIAYKTTNSRFPAAGRGVVQLFGQVNDREER